MNGVLTSSISLCEANFAADALTKYAHSLSVGLYIFGFPPASINHFLLHDMYEVAYPRFVLSYLSLRSPYVPKKNVKRPHMYVSAIDPFFWVIH